MVLFSRKYGLLKTLLISVATIYITILYLGWGTDVANVEDEVLTREISRRAAAVRRICDGYRGGARVEAAALRTSADLANPNTAVRFGLGGHQFQLCTVLKGGSLSWKTFFKVNNISHHFLSENVEAKSEFQTSLIQVRHPFTRLLSAWRHIFQAEGWRNLEVRFVNNPHLMEKGKYIKSWQLLCLERLLMPFRVS